MDQMEPASNDEEKLDADVTTDVRLTAVDHDDDQEAGDSMMVGSPMEMIYSALDGQNVEIVTDETVCGEEAIGMVDTHVVLDTAMEMVDEVIVLNDGQACQQFADIQVLENELPVGGKPVGDVIVLNATSAGELVGARIGTIDETPMETVSATIARSDVLPAEMVDASSVATEEMVVASVTLRDRLIGGGGPDCAQEEEEEEMMAGEEDGSREPVGSNRSLEALFQAARSELRNISKRDDGPAAGAVTGAAVSEAAGVEVELPVGFVVQTVPYAVTGTGDARRAQMMVDADREVLASAELAPFVPPALPPAPPGLSLAVAAMVGYGPRKRKTAAAPPPPGRHVCPYCGRGCAKPSVLQKHVRAHTGERPYPCLPCGFAFKTKSNLYKHCKSRAHVVKAGLKSAAAAAAAAAATVAADRPADGDAVASGIHQVAPADTAVVTMPVAAVVTAPVALTPCKVLMTDGQFYDVTSSGEIGAVISSVIVSGGLAGRPVSPVLVIPDGGGVDDGVDGGVDDGDDGPLIYIVDQKDEPLSGAFEETIVEEVAPDEGVGDPHGGGAGAGEGYRPALQVQFSSEMLQQRISHLILENAAIVDTPMAEAPRAKRVARHSSLCALADPVPRLVTAHSLDSAHVAAAHSPDYAHVAAAHSLDSAHLLDSAHVAAEVAPVPREIRIKIRLPRPEPGQTVAPPGGQLENSVIRNLLLQGRGAAAGSGGGAKGVDSSLIGDWLRLKPGGGGGVEGGAAGHVLFACGRCAQTFAGTAALAEHHAACPPPPPPGGPDPAPSCARPPPVSETPKRGRPRGSRNRVGCESAAGSTRPTLRLKIPPPAGFLPPAGSQSAGALPYSVSPSTPLSLLAKLRLKGKILMRRSLSVERMLQAAEPSPPVAVQRAAARGHCGAAGGVAFRRCESLDASAAPSQKHGLLYQTLTRNLSVAVAQADVIVIDDDEVAEPGAGAGPGGEFLPPHNQPPSVVSPSDAAVAPPPTAASDAAHHLPVSGAGPGAGPGAELALLLRGHASPLLSSSTHPAFCCIAKPQPCYVATGAPRVSMYSDWRAAPAPPHPLGLAPHDLLDLYRSSRRSGVDAAYVAATCRPDGVTSTAWSVALGSAPLVSSRGATSPTPAGVATPEVVIDGSGGGGGGGVSAAELEGGFKSTEAYEYVRGRGRGAYVCRTCGIRCRKPSMLRKHARTHTDARPYECTLCRFAFKTKGNLTKHYKSKAHTRRGEEGGGGGGPEAGDDDDDDGEEEDEEEEEEEEEDDELEMVIDEELVATTTSLLNGKTRFADAMTVAVNVVVQTDVAPSPPPDTPHPAPAPHTVCKSPRNSESDEKDRKVKIKGSPAGKRRELIDKEIAVSLLDLSKVPDDSADGASDDDCVDAGQLVSGAARTTAAHLDVKMTASLSQQLLAEGAVCLSAVMPSASAVEGAQLWLAGGRGEGGRPVPSVTGFVPPLLARPSPKDVATIKPEPFPVTLPTGIIVNVASEARRPSAVTLIDARAAATATPVGGVKMPTVRVATPTILTATPTAMVATPTVSMVAPVTAAATPVVATATPTAASATPMTGTSSQNIPAVVLRAIAPSVVAPLSALGVTTLRLTNLVTPTAVTTASGVATPTAAMATPTCWVTTVATPSRTSVTAATPISQLLNVATPISKLINVVTPVSKNIFNLAVPISKLHVAPPTSQLTNVATPTCKLMNVVTPTTMLTNVAMPTSKLTNVAAPTCKLMNVVTPTTMLMNMATPSCKSTNVAPPTCKLTNVAMPTIKLTSAVTPTCKLTSVATPTCTLTSVATPIGTTASAATPPICGTPSLISAASRDRGDATATGDDVRRPLVAAGGTSGGVAAGDARRPLAAGVATVRFVTGDGRAPYEILPIPCGGGGAAAASVAALVGGRYVCDVCACDFAHAHQLTLHRHIHALEPPFRCADCGATFRLSGRLERHRCAAAPGGAGVAPGGAGANPRPFSCDACGVAFRNAGHLAKHLRSKLHDAGVQRSGQATPGDHSPDGAVPAVEGSDVSPDELGHVTAVSAVTRKSHDLGSGGGGGSKDFRVYQQVDEFEKDDHASNERVTVEIKSTPIEFVTVASPQEAAGQEVVTGSDVVCLSEHGTTTTAATDATPGCDARPTSVAQLPQLKSHLVSHVELRPYVCEFCDAGFTTAQSLTFHLGIHTQKCPYICGVCGDTFASSPLLKAHVPTHVVGASLPPPAADATATTTSPSRKRTVASSDDATTAGRTCAPPERKRLRRQSAVLDTDRAVEGATCGDTTTTTTQSEPASGVITPPRRGSVQPDRTSSGSGDDHQGALSGEAAIGRPLT